MQSAERAKALVQRLLAFARQQPLQLRAIDMAALVRGMADLVGSTIGPKIKLVLEVPEELPPARADHNQLEMALLNLCVNARDAMPDGGTLQIAVSAQTVAGDDARGLTPGPYISLSVSDSGTGMDEETARRAVEPFFSTKGLGKGTGLGLSMAHGLARQLGGSLTITTAPGAGTKVEILLPVSAELPRREEPGVERRTPQEGTALLVDDDDLVRSSVSQMLNAIGYEVVEAKSAEQALELVKDGLSPTVVVTDHLMSGIGRGAWPRVGSTDAGSDRLRLRGEQRDRAAFGASHEAVSAGRAISEARRDPGPIQSRRSRRLSSVASSSKRRGAGAPPLSVSSPWPAWARPCRPWEAPPRELRW